MFTLEIARYCENCENISAFFLGRSVQERYYSSAHKSALFSPTFSAISHEAKKWMDAAWRHVVCQAIYLLG